MAAKLVFGCLLSLALAADVQPLDEHTCAAGTCHANSDDVGMLQVAKRMHDAPAVAPLLLETGGKDGVASQRNDPITSMSFKVRGKTPLCRAEGARAWITQDALDYLGEALLPMLIAEFDGAKFPQISNSTMCFKFELNDLTFKNIGLKLKLSFLADVGLRLDVESLTADVSFAYAAAGDCFLTKIISTSGTADVSLGPGTSISADVGADLSAKGHPELTVQGVKLNIDLAKFEVQNTVLAGPINALKFLIPRIAGSLLASMVADLPTTINPILKELSFRLPVPIGDSEKIGLQADFSLCSITAAKDYLAVGVVGEAISATNPLLVYPMEPLPIPQLPPQGWQDDMVSITMTKWTLNSALWIAQQLGLLSFEITTKDLQALNSGVKLDTNFLLKVVPGMKAYTPARDVAVVISPWGTPGVYFNESYGIAVDAPLKLAFEVILGNARIPVFELKIPFGAAAKVAVQTTNGTERVVVDLEGVRFTPVQVPVTLVGLVRLPMLNFLLSVINQKVLMPKLRSALEAGIPIVGAKGVSLENLWLGVDDFFNAHASIGLNLKETVIAVFGDRAGFVDAIFKYMESPSFLQRVAEVKAKHRRARARRVGNDGTRRASQ